MCDVETLTKIATCLDVPAGNIYLDEHNVLRRKHKNKIVSGFTTIIMALVRESKSEIAENSIVTREIEAQVYELIEYSALYIATGLKQKHMAQQLLQDLNKYLITRTHLVPHYITVADLAVFYTIRPLMKTLSIMDKEKYINVSRWFNYLQKLPEMLKTGDDVLNFKTIYLYGWVTGTHT